MMWFIVGIFLLAMVWSALEIAWAILVVAAMGIGWAWKRMRRARVKPGHVLRGP
jgi:Flp pilus assembly protein TadB